MSGQKPGILLIGNYPPPFGGIPTHLLYLAEYLASRGWEAHVLPGNLREFGLKTVGESIFIHRPTKKERLRTLLNKKYRRPGFSMWKRSGSKLRTYLSEESRVAYARKVALENNIKLISAYHIFGAATVGALISEELSLPMITTIFGEIYSHTQQFLSRIAEVERVAQRTVRWLSCSDHCARSMELLGLPISVETLYYGIDTNHFRPDQDGSSIRARFGIKPNERVVIFVGRMKNEMGLGVLLQTIPLVLRKRDDIHFLIVGARGELTEPARALSARNPRTVHVAKDLPYAELPLAYAAANISVSPSINARACLGLAIAEALSVGKPVIGCDVGGTREVLVHGDMGTVIPPHDPFALRDAILDLIDDDDRIAAMGQRGRERVLRLFDKDLTNRRMEEIMEEAVAPRVAVGVAGASRATAGA